MRFALRCRPVFLGAIREGLAPSNPVINTNKREERPRDRVLSNDELRRRLAVTPPAPLSILVNRSATSRRHCERSEAIQNLTESWIASSLSLLAMTRLFD